MKKSIFLFIGILVISLLLLINFDVLDTKKLVIKKNDKNQNRKISSVEKTFYKNEIANPNKTIIKIKRFNHERRLDLEKMKKYVRKNREPSPIEAYFDDDKVVIEGRDFLISQSLRSLPNNEYDDRDGLKIANLSGYILYESTDNSRGQLALYSKRSMAPAVLTGRVILKNITKEQAFQLASQFDVDLDTSMEHLGYFAIVAPVDALETARELGPQISSPEVIEGHLHAN